MLIDVAISNIAQPEILEEVIESLSKKFLGGAHQFRFVLFEFRVGKNNRAQQQASYNWIKKHRALFNEIIMLNRTIEDDRWFKDMVARIKSDYFLHIEGNSPLIAPILLDVVIAIMAANFDGIPQIVFNNGEITADHIIDYEDVDDLKFGELNFFSRSVGIYNTELIRNILDYIKENELSYSHVDLMKASNALGYKNYVLADRKKHVDIM